MKMYISTAEVEERKFIQPVHELSAKVYKSSINMQKF